MIPLGRRGRRTLVGTSDNRTTMVLDSVESREFVRIYTTSFDVILVWPSRIDDIGLTRSAVRISLRLQRKLGSLEPVRVRVASSTVIVCSVDGRVAVVLLYCTLSNKLQEMAQITGGGAGMECSICSSSSSLQDDAAESGYCYNGKTIGFWAVRMAYCELK